MGRVVGGARGGLQPWGRPPALQGERGGWSAAVGSPTCAAWEGGGCIAAVGSPTGAAGEGGRWSAAVGSTTGAPGGGWRVGGQPLDGPLALPRKGGV